MSLLKCMSIQHKTRKKIMQLDWVLFFLLTWNFFFWLRTLNNNSKWCIKKLKTLNKSTFILKNTSHQDKLCTLYQCWKNGTPNFIKVNMLLCRIDTYYSFWFIKTVIGVLKTDLFREIYSTTKLIGRVENNVSKWKLVPTT